MMKQSVPIFRSLVVAAAALLTGCAAGAEPGPAAAPPPRSMDAQLALATFDSAWSRIHHSYYDTTFKGLDWTAVRDELRPRAAAARNDAELRRVLVGMLDRLGDSHFAVIPREVYDVMTPREASAAGRAAPGDAGLDLRLVGDELVVFRVEAGGPAAAAGVRPGWVVEAIGAQPVEKWLQAVHRLDGESERAAMRWRIVPLATAALHGDAGSAVRVRFHDAAGVAVEHELVRQELRGEPVRFGNLPTVMVNVEHDRVPLGGGCVGVIRFNIWMTAINPLFERAMTELADCAGIVVDLRGNHGGVGGLSMGIASYFVDEVVPFGIMKTRQSELRFVTNPRRVTSRGTPTQPFAGPLAIIVDPYSVSTSEVFAAGLQAIGRARVFGETTAGQVLPALMVELPNQDVLYHAIADFTDPHGVRLEGRGVIPDEPVELSRQALLGGDDPSLDAAIRWIRTSRAAQAAAP
jgi:carboxyl-terminal processing protease